MMQNTTFVVLLKGEKMDDLISRQAAIDALNKLSESTYEVDYGVVDCDDAINAIAALPPTEPKRGKWIYHIDDLFPAESTMECNQCHAEQPLTCDDEFCPHCGAKMEVTE